jgi:hypothetical protein
VSTLTGKHHCIFKKKESRLQNKKKTGNDKLKAKIEDKGVQCNTMRSLIKDLKDEIG